MKRFKMPAVNVGGSSVLVIFTVLALVTFSIMSFASARADWRLASRQEETLLQRQKAAAAAERRLAELDAVLAPLWDMPVDPSADQWVVHAQVLLADQPVVAAFEDGGLLVSYETANGQAVTRVRLFFEAGFSGPIRAGILTWQTEIRLEEGGGQVKLPD